MSHRALITGISGFVGSFLAGHLLESGDAVLGCSPDGLWSPISDPALADRVDVVRWDLADPAGPTDAIRHTIENFSPSVIYHLGALSIPADCGLVEPTTKAEAVNVAGTRRVLSLAGALESRPRVLFVSSAMVYAPVTPLSAVVDENAPLGPRAGYAKTKAEAEAEVGRACEEDGCDALVARAFQHTGPRQESRLMLPEWASQFAHDDPGPVYVHTCDASIDLTDVRDVVRAYRLLVEKGRKGEVYNVGLGTARMSGDVLEVLRRMAGPSRPIIETRPGFKQDPIADVSRLTAATGWKPVIPLEKTVADTFAWWKEQVGERL